DNGGCQENRSARRYQGQSRLNREVKAFDVNVEMFVEVRFLDLAERLESGNAGVGEHNVDAPELLAEPIDETGNVGELAGIGRDRQRAPTQFPLRRGN